VLRASWRPTEAEQDALSGQVPPPAPEAGDEVLDGQRPAPPDGWYEPYVPDAEPAEESQAMPRSDAW
jgi:hypothetical protein